MPSALLPAALHPPEGHLAAGFPGLPLKPSHTCLGFLAPGWAHRTLGSTMRGRQRRVWPRCPALRCHVSDLWELWFCPAPSVPLCWLGMTTSSVTSMREGSGGLGGGGEGRESSVGHSRLVTAGGRGKGRGGGSEQDSGFPLGLASRGAAGWRGVHSAAPWCPCSSTELEVGGWNSSVLWRLTGCWGGRPLKDGAEAQTGETPLGLLPEPLGPREEAKRYSPGEPKWVRGARGVLLPVGSEALTQALSDISPPNRGYQC